MLDERIRQVDRDERRKKLQIINVNYFRQVSISCFVYLESYFQRAVCSHGQKLSILWRLAAIFARTVASALEGI